MKMLSWIVLLCALGGQVQAACDWPAWEQFKKDYVSAEGRVIDPSDSRKITTSEGQSYGLFFALAANDRQMFATLFNWTQNNLAQGSLRDHLPAWLWGKKSEEAWTVLDSNSASDSDIWIAWTLLEAGRLWKNDDYTDTGKALLAKIAADEVVNVPGLGLMLLPGRVGFAEETRWRFNPATSLLRWHSISAASARRGLRCAIPTSNCCLIPPERLFAGLGELRKSEGLAAKRGECDRRL